MDDDQEQQEQQQQQQQQQIRMAQHHHHLHHSAPSLSIPLEDSNHDVNNVNSSSTNLIDENNTEVSATARSSDIVHENVHQSDDAREEEEEANVEEDVHQDTMVHTVQEVDEQQELEEDDDGQHYESESESEENEEEPSTCDASTTIEDEGSEQLPTTSLEPPPPIASGDLVKDDDGKPATEESKEIMLECEWVFYYDEGAPKGSTCENYQSYVKNLGSFNSVQGFWRYWNNLLDVSLLPQNANLRLFKSGVDPTWEDPANQNGGKWTLMCSPDQASNIVMRTILTLIGEQLEYSTDICGFVLSVRPNRHVVNIWNKTGDNQEIIDRTSSELSSFILGKSFKYQAHKYAMSPQTPKRELSSPKLYLEDGATPATPTRTDSPPSPLVGQSPSVRHKPKDYSIHKKSQSTPSLQFVSLKTSTNSITSNNNSHHFKSTPQLKYSNSSLVNSSAADLIPSPSPSRHNNSNGYAGNGNGSSNHRTYDRNQSTQQQQHPSTPGSGYKRKEYPRSLSGSFNRSTEPSGDNLHQMLLQQQRPKQQQQQQQSPPMAEATTPSPSPLSSSQSTTDQQQQQLQEQQASSSIVVHREADKNVVEQVAKDVQVQPDVQHELESSPSTMAEDSLENTTSETDSHQDESQQSDYGSNMSTDQALGVSLLGKQSSSSLMTNRKKKSSKSVPGSASSSKGKSARSQQHNHHKNNQHSRYSASVSVTKEKSTSLLVLCKEHFIIISMLLAIPIITIILQRNY
ncbi:hypothetical protein SAMD00019534_041100 [Acytostelium subglobosum LB1]|uniref:hypothetical protein n=1 Tax=Acytostelium subglobosum LB1 TaxID=1410327 RepID=UPI0006449179|nr:hypothetical protein SAMD00019534_041100 [Acytostelium subglobosum LB1]GAM20935.1 hypothetical protein SAMD00019534_041100 [Acytostelium subglobosum LB1]|eukprot:XP_012756069.1 hypothetical protein SAMD00019534_041100 [Acytostelium subglobosum LB1]